MGAARCLGPPSQPQDMCCYGCSDADDQIQSQAQDPSPVLNELPQSGPACILVALVGVPVTKHEGKDGLHKRELRQQYVA